MNAEPLLTSVVAALAAVRLEAILIGQRRGRAARRARDHGLPRQFADAKGGKVFSFDKSAGGGFEFIEACAY